MITLPASQSALVGSGSYCTVSLFHLTTYSDRDAATVESEHWWSDVPVLYKWDGVTARQFVDVVASSSAITQAMAPVPDGTLDARKRSLSLQLTNHEVDGQRLWKTLRALNLGLSRLEAASLLMPVSRWESTQGGAFGTVHWSDLTDLSNDHVVRFRGELVGVGAVTEESITLNFQNEELVPPWARATDVAEVQPDHLGRRYAVPVGVAKGVPVVNRVVGGITTLVTPITTTTQTGSIEVTDATIFPPSGPFDIQMGAERMACTYVDATHISITTRGVDSSTAALHRYAEVMAELVDNSVFVVAGIGGNSCTLDALCAVSPFTGECVRVDSSLYTVDTDDTTTDGAGTPLTTVTFNRAGFDALLDALIAAAEVTAQPTIDGVDVVEIPLEARDVSTDTTPRAATNFTGLRECLEPSISDSTPVVAVKTDSTPPNTFHHTIGYWVPNGSLAGDQRDVVRWKLLVDTSYSSGGGDTGTHDLIGYADFFGSKYSQVIKSFSGADQSTFGDIATIPSTGVWVIPGTAQKLEDVYNTAGSPENDGPGVNFHVRTSTPDANFPNITFTVKPRLVVELEPNPLTDVEIAAATLGYGIQFVADVTHNVTGTAGQNTAAHVAEWFLSTYMGRGAGAIDATSFTQAKTDLTNEQLAGDLASSEVLTEAEVLARIGVEGRCSIVQSEGSTATQFRVLAAAAGTHTYPAAARELLDVRDVSESVVPATDQATGVTLHYIYRSERGGGLAAFAGTAMVDADNPPTVVAQPTQAELDAAVARWGTRPAEPRDLLLVQDDDTAARIAAFYAHEFIREATVLAGTVDQSQGYDLQLGDVVTWAPPWDPFVTVKVRVVQIVFALGAPTVGITAVEVE